MSDSSPNNPPVEKAALERTQLDRLLMQLVPHIRRLIALPVEEREELLTQFAQHEPACPDLEEEGDALAARFEGDPDAARAAILLLARWPQSGVRQLDQLIIDIAGLLPETGTEELSGFIRRYDRVAEQLTRRFDIVSHFVGSMPSYSASSAPASLQQVVCSALDKPVLVAGAIVRLSLDEGDDVVFQANRVGLRRLADAILDTLAEVDALQAKADSFDQAE